ncbi:MAG: hypothetical protein ACKVS9_10350 [Phycisphaerae bacterium]
MIDMQQELMTPQEAAKWFRRSEAWLRKQPDLIRMNSGTQPLFHVRACRAFVLGRLAGLSGDPLRAMQLRALAEACGVPVQQFATTRTGAANVPEALVPAN